VAELGRGQAGTGFREAESRSAVLIVSPLEPSPLLRCYNLATVGIRADEQSFLVSPGPGVVGFENGRAAS
jgi:hypothetical protein